MAAASEGELLAVLPASQVYGRVVERIRALEGGGGGRRRRTSSGSKLLDQAAGRLAALQEDLAGIEQAVAADVAHRSLPQIRDAAYRLHHLLDDLEYGRFRPGVDPEEVGHHPLPCLPSLYSDSGRRRRRRRRLLHEFGAAAAESGRLVTQLGREKRAGAPTPRVPALDPPAAVVPPEHSVVGRRAEQELIVQSLIRSSPHHHLSVISVFGLAGAGKTTLAELVFDDVRVEQHFDLRIWVSASAATNQLDIAREILQSASPGHADAMAGADFPSLQSGLSRLVASHRFLLVLDDLCQSHKMEPLHRGTWTSIFTPLQTAEIGSSVLVTTPRMMVAKMLATTSEPYVLRKLGTSECSDLFVEHALSLSGRNVDCSPELQHIGKGIADKLQGLPLPAKVLGGVLGATRSTEARRSIVDAKISGDVARRSVQLCYACLPPHLKECFAYCALFPKNWKFDRTNLIHLWMAEGFVMPRDAQERMEDLGSEYFDVLTSLSIFQQHKKGPKTYYMMHHLFHDLAETVSTNNCFRVEAGFSEEIPSTVRRLSVTTDNLVDLNTYHTLEQLHTLLVLRSPLFSLQDEHMSKLTNLRVLVLRGCNLTELPEEVGALTHLRYLSLCATLKRLPDSLSRLLHLQMLCFPEDCCLDKLPTGTTNLFNLRHLDIDTKYIAKLESIRSLVNLQGSVEIHVEKGKGRILRDLRDIKDLRGQLKITGLDNVSAKEDACKAELSDKQYLKILELEWSSASRIDSNSADADVLKNLRPHPNLRELHITRYGGSTTPSWLQFPLLKELQSLHLTNCRNLSILPPLGRLPLLEKLHMKELSSVYKIGPEFYSSDNIAFPSLRVLELIDFPRLHEWLAEVNRDSFPCLNSLRIIDCPKLTQVPLLPATTAEVVIDRICSIKHLKFATFSSSSVMLTLDTCTTTVLCKRLFHQKQLDSIAVLNINGGELFASTEGLSSLRFLQKLQLCRSDMTDQSFSLFLQALPSLSSLEMIDLPNITALPQQEDLSFCSTLSELYIRDCPLLVSLFSLQAFISLKCLVIERCPKLSAASFPINFANLAYLKMLSISYCLQFESLPAGGLPPSLEVLNLVGCHPKLVEQLRNKTDNSRKNVATVPQILIQ
ncbi:hypothetical protein ACP4OV_010363 [Aristida adscensionis]